MCMCSIINMAECWMCQASRIRTHTHIQTHKQSEKEKKTNRMKNQFFILLDLALDALIVCGRAQLKSPIQFFLFCIVGTTTTTTLPAVAATIETKEMNTLIHKQSSDGDGGSSSSKNRRQCTGHWAHK